ncbi:MAG: serine/threonine protein kinase [Nannocystis sp.]|nr:serine/threonine-protein kinase [Nannocystis sp.]MBA3550334.1 serine/threonine protein kinase [Nannocystis sp.]
MSTLVGTRIDKYEIQSEVGHGGMAVVYRGLDTVLNREVAIKVLHPHMAAREESRARLRREALTVARLRHENILEIYDYSGENAAESFLVTEFIHGMTLREWLDTRWRPRPALAALVVHRLCVALGHAHKIGIVHRDIKPENVMIRDDGCLKLMDFGIAQIIDHQKLTMTGQLLGSPAYMAPELISGKPIDARTDLFAVGIMLYQLATGTLPFSGRNPHEVLSRIADAEYPKACTVCPLVDDELETIIAKALSREPDLRYQSAEDFARELERYLEVVGIPASQDEVIAYFLDCDRYVDQLDQRVCAALMQRAEAAAKAGHSARAIRLLGRVLELEKDQKQAKTMLSRLRTRERTVRRVMIGAASLGLTALSSGAAVLWYMTPPTVENLTRGEEPAIVDERPRVPVKPRPNPPAQPRIDPADTTGTTGGTTAVEPQPRKGTTTRPLDAKINRPTPARCNLRIRNMPVALIHSGSHTLKMGSVAQQLREDLVPVEIADATLQIQLTGTMYTAVQTLQRKDCAGNTLDFEARPKPATVTFTGAPPKTTVRCMAAPCRDTTTPFTVGSGTFPPIPMSEHEVEISVELKAIGYQGKVDKFRIQPGNNPRPVNLTALSPR